MQKSTHFTGIMDVAKIKDDRACNLNIRGIHLTGAAVWTLWSSQLNGNKFQSIEIKRAQN
jgi:hypothetical protein